MREPVAIVGLGCVLPGAHRPEAFWANLVASRVALGEVPASAWDHRLYFSADRSDPDRTYCRYGAFVSDFDFDWRRFRVPPADARAVNPMQWMILEAGYQALSSVGTLPQDTTAILIGSTGLGWQRDQGLRIRLDDMLEAARESEAFRALPEAQREEALRRAAERLTSRLKEVSEDNVVGASASVAAGRINMHFDLKGPHYAVDAGFASSLAALDLAVQGLREGEFDLALAGGASELLTPLEMVAFSRLGGISAEAVRPFDARADGTLLGEGVALFALKRLDDALRDGNTIHAVILGTGGSSDGRGKSLVAPRSEGQALAMQAALEDAGRPAVDSFAFIECHATGTQVGDASEVRALRSVYSAAPSGAITLGSVKANVGHLRAAAGAAGLLKAVLSLQNGHYPAQPDLGEINPRLELDGSPFRVAREPLALASDRPVRAAVSSFSFGGNNFHAVLERWLPSKPAPRRSRSRPTAEPMAIVGMGSILPGANDPAELWQRLLEGYDRTSKVPADRWSIERYCDPSGKAREKAYTDLGCFLDALPSPGRTLRVPPTSWPTIDPSHVLMAQAAEQALADAGFEKGRWDPSRVAISLAFLPYQGKKFLADIRVNWRELETELDKALEALGLDPGARAELLRSAEARFKQGLPPITEDTLVGYMGSLNAGRIAWHHDFHGPHFVVDAACASGHAALHAAHRMLTHRRADVVISGGVWCDMMPEFFVAACRFNALSARGSFPFDASADGFIPGEGAGALVLKRLEDAERDGDRIRGVLRAVAGSSDGRGRSVLAPSPAGEALAMRRALDRAGIAPASVDYVECHGTGTALGDVVEANAAAEIYGSGRERPLGIGSIKSNIGHLNAAAGIAGLVKATLAVEAGTIPPSIKCTTRNPKLPDNVEVITATRDWPSGSGGGPRRAGVSAFGVGGANFHAIVEEYRPSPPAKTSSPEKPVSRLLAFAADSAEACLAQLEAHLQSLQAGGELKDTMREPDGDWRLALTAADLPELTRKTQLLRTALAGGGPLAFLAQSGIFIAGPSDPLAGAPVAVLFPGQGGQYANMLRELSREYPGVAETLAEADRAWQAMAGAPLTASFFTDAPEQWRQSDEEIHAAVLAVNVALSRLMRQHGIEPAVLVGQSAGELAALVEAGALSLADALAAIRARTLAVLELETDDPGTMLALACGAERAQPLLEGLDGYAALAADNGPGACIVSADRRAAETLRGRCDTAGIEYTVLAVSHGYHSELIGGARPRYQQALEALTFSPLRRPVISTIDGRGYEGRALRELPPFLASQFVEPVRLRQAILEAHDRGVRLFLEAGPKWSLTQFTRSILEGRAHAACASVHPKIGEVEQFKRLLAQAFVHRAGRLRPAPHTEREEIVLTTSVTETPRPDPRQTMITLPLELALPESRRREMAIALGRRFGVDASGATASDLQSLESIAAYVERLRAAAPAPQTNGSGALAQQIEAALIETVVARTGYPPEMLDPDLDLEADLGIDTVKQVDIFATVRERFSIPRDPNRTLREFNTLRKVLAHLVEQAGGAKNAPVPAPAAVAPTAPVAAPPSAAREVPSMTTDARPATASLEDAAEQIRRVLIANVVEKTGYPEEMLELDLDLEADLGIDTVKQVDIFARTREHFGLARDPKASLRDFNTLRKVIDHLAPALVAKQSPGAAPTLTPAAAIASAAAVPVTPVANPGPAAPPASAVLGTLLSMDLGAELGLGDEEKRRLTEVFASRLGVSPSPELASARTFDELIALISRTNR